MSFPQTQPITRIQSDGPTTIEETLARRRANAARPICSLPTELISYVLLCCRYQPLEYQDQLLEQESLLRLDVRDWFAWLPAVHVCHRLREVALFTPRLWDRICVCGEDIFTTFLARSNGLPIDVALINRGLQLPLLRLVLQQLPRLRSLCIVAGRNAYDVKNMEPWVGLPAPHLDRIQLVDVDDLNELRMLDLLFLSHMPSMRYLHTAMREVVALPSTLTRLSVTMQVPWRSTSARAKEVLSLLRTLPLLENLQFFERDTDDELDPFDEIADALADLVVDLPRLEIFGFIGSPLACLCFLDHVSFPSECKQHLTMLAGDFETFDYLEEIQTLLTRNILNKNGQSAHFDTLRLHRSNDMFSTYGFTKHTIPSPFPHGYSPHAEFVFQRLSGGYLQYDVAQWCDFLCDIMEGFMSSLRNLELYPPYPYRPPKINLSPVLRQMSNIEQLSVLRWPLRGLMSFIPATPGDDGGEQVLLPNLRKLVLYEFDFAADVEDIETGEDDGPAGFIGWLRERRERGAGIKTLALKNPVNLLPESVQRMSMEVEEVLCDHPRLVEDEDGPDAEDEQDADGTGHRVTP